MHRCLHTPDIFNLILEFVSLLLWDDDPYHGHDHYYSSNPVLAALARTCRTFLEPTLDVMWRSQLTVGPLVRTLPSDAIQEEVRIVGPVSIYDIVRITRPLTTSDWERFDYYARRVTSLGYFMTEFPDQDLTRWVAHNYYPCRHPVSSQVMARLCLYRRRSALLPNLVHLRWCNHDLPNVEYIPMFLGPKLATLSLAFHPEWIKRDPMLPNRLYDMVPRILDAAHALCPSLNDLELRAVQDELTIQSATRWAFKCNTLVGFAVTCAGSTELLHHLACQESLRTATIFFDEDLVEELPKLSPPSLRYPFPALDSITLDIPTLASCTEFIRTLGPCKLRIGSPSQVTRATHSLTLAVLEPALAFSNLRVFRLSCHMYGRLSDRDLMRIADSWPLMLDLRFLDGWGWHMQSRLTWAGLAYVAWRCPMLFELALAIDMTVENVAKVTSREDFRPNGRLHWVNLLDSRMHDPEVCARSVHAFAPTLYEFCGNGYVSRDKEGNVYPPDQDPMAFYLSVTDLLRKLQKGASISEQGEETSFCGVMMHVQSCAHSGFTDAVGDAALMDLNPWA
ncbi:hypothetical protein C8Q76DRAFT_608386 [Earliella scabrosa]|nr:hypothetical protein C8Q76DRAFT_608386 [Earliella scabrosa]